MKVKYTGTSDFQEFSKADFEKAGVEDQGKVRFAKDEPKDISESAAEALLSKDGVFGDYSFEEADEDDEPRSAPSENTDADAPVNESSDAPTDTGRGTSTRGSTRSRSTGGQGTSTT